MSVTNKQFSIWAASMVASLAAAFAAAGASQASNGPALCEIVARSSGGIVAVSALAHAGGNGMTGSYRLTVSGDGTDIRQGGAFAARAGETVRLGSAELDEAGGGYDVKLDVTAGDVTASCAKYVGDRL